MSVPDPVQKAAEEQAPAATGRAPDTYHQVHLLNRHNRILVSS